MLKKSLTLQIILLTIEILLGMSLTRNLVPNFKLVHTVLGLLAGLTTITSAYLAYRAKQPNRTIAVAVAAVGLTFFAGVGGKLAETNYAQGLLLMRVTGFSALLATILCLYLATRSMDTA